MVNAYYLSNHCCSLNVGFILFLRCARICANSVCFVFFLKGLTVLVGPCMCMPAYLNGGGGVFVAIKMNNKFFIFNKLLRLLYSDSCLVS